MGFGKHTPVPAQSVQTLRRRPCSHTCRNNNHGIDQITRTHHDSTHVLQKLPHDLHIYGQKLVTGVSHHDLQFVGHVSRLTTNTS